MKKSGIYKIVNLVNNKVYVGQSNWINKRIGVHKRFLRANKHCNVHLQNAYNKYGEQNFIFDVIEYCSEDKLNEREQYWINYYDSYKNGYNMTLGGDGSRGYFFSKESKEKMSFNHADFTGDKNPMYKKNIKDFMTEEDYSRWLLSHKNSPHKKGIIKSQKSIQKQKESLKIYYKNHVSPNKGKPLSKEHLQKLMEGKNKYFQQFGNPHSTKVICLNTLRIYNSIKEAAIKYNISASEISSCCLHLIKSAGKDDNNEKLIWLYLDEYNHMNESQRSHYYEECFNANCGRYNSQAKKVYCVTTNEYFDTVRSAAKKYNVDASSLCKCCKGKIKYCGKLDNQQLIWQYI